MGSGKVMADIKAGLYTKENGKCVAEVAASKSIDVYGCLPSSPLKLRAAG